ncbi:phosphohydrolase [Enterococcus thailandicus]|uniref:metallophosphoesterase n=1 Tax=Enterococcus TaxID=1350 RepID=UPI00244D7EED|nr:metallophosphoesterase [Enterococcus thailandicus]MDK4352197.1 metallophosphoesterase [Enterococcus thailandicus]MDT2735014.1 metallophosphoesterase [Enterococcus thailandicus]GMC02757.1 phosphohydrolase [Enterococcus thailandicus]GMC09755.1 phosphohydrolase [Enterococcus thailandicus]
MGKLAVISDLHVDINKFGESQMNDLWQVLQKKEITRLHLAGDIANKVNQALAVVDFFAMKGLPTTFNFGNHELADVTGEPMMNHFPDNHFLNERYLALNDHTVLLGMNGWYDYQFSELTDEEQILRMKRLYWYDRMIEREGTDLEVNEQVLVATKQLLETLTQKNLDVILATHFVPKKEFIVYQSAPYERWNKLNAFLGSASMGQLLDQYTNVKQVVFGHTHRRFEDQVIQGTKYSCRPFGYYYEWQLTRQFVLQEKLVEKYNPMKLRGVLRDHYPAFLAYQKKHLQEEFERALTIIDY